MSAIKVKAAIKACFIFTNQVIDKCFILHLNIWTKLVRHASSAAAPVSGGSL